MVHRSVSGPSALWPRDREIRGITKTDREPWNTGLAVLIPVVLQPRLARLAKVYPQYIDAIEKYRLNLLGCLGVKGLGGWRLAVGLAPPAAASPASLGLSPDGQQVILEVLLDLGQLLAVSFGQEEPDEHRGAERHCGEEPLYPVRTSQECLEAPVALQRSEQ